MSAAAETRVRLSRAALASLLSVLYVLVVKYPVMRVRAVYFDAPAQNGLFKNLRGHAGRAPSRSPRARPHPQPRGLSAIILKKHQVRSAPNKTLKARVVNQPPRFGPMKLMLIPSATRMLAASSAPTIWPAALTRRLSKLNAYCRASCSSSHSRRTVESAETCTRDSRNFPSKGQLGPPMAPDIRKFTVTLPGGAGPGSCAALLSSCGPSKLPCRANFPSLQKRKSNHELVSSTSGDCSKLFEQLMISFTYSQSSAEQREM